MKISETLNAELLTNPAKIDLLKQDAANYLKKMEVHWVEVLFERSDKVLSATTVEQFFRSKERNEKTSQTLQYLLTFLTHIPGPAEIEREPVNPAEQFREFIRFQVDLLLEEDVKKAVFNEINQMGSLNGDNIWDYLERVIEKNRELNELIITGASEVSSIFFTSCLVLEQLCLFWFDVKQQDIRRVRRSDIYIYKLARILQGRYQQTREL
jgi:hypothetical protein